MNRNIVIVLGIIFLVGAWFLAAPLFIDATVDENADFLAADGQVDLQAVLGMPDEKQLAMRSVIMEAAANAPDREMSEAMPADTPAVIATGNFIDADRVHRGSGDATVYALPDGRHVVRFENFRTTNGPALVVYLAEHPSPVQATDVTDGGYLSLGKLKGNVGNQNYTIPASIDISDYHSVVIWCELFGVLFSPAALTTVERGTSD